PDHRRVQGAALASRLQPPLIRLFDRDVAEALVDPRHLSIGRDHLERLGAPSTGPRFGGAQQADAERAAMIRIDPPGDLAGHARAAEQLRMPDHREQTDEIAGGSLGDEY